MAQYGFALPLTQQGTRSREKPETCLGKSSVLCGPGNPLAISLAYDETTGMLPTKFTGIMLCWKGIHLFTKAMINKV